ncbi:MAG: formyl transferase [Dehalococcoidia bacterium]|nr:formyl transferase [Dehalococcoidia bacterium]
MPVLLLGPHAEELIPIVQDEVTVLNAEPCTIQLIDSLMPDFVVSFGYRRLVPPEIIKAVGGRIINLHISYLPWNRGADPNLWSWLTGTPKGVTVHWLTTGLDKGPVIAQETITFDASRHTLRTSYHELHKQVLGLLGRVWESVRAGSAPRTEQVGTGSYHRSADKDLYLSLMPLGWDTPCAEVAELGRRHGLVVDQVG